MQTEDDEILMELKTATGPIIDKIEREVDSDRAIMVLGAKELTAEGEYAGIQTFVDICGDYGIIGEALYTELLDQVADGKPALFNMLRALIKALEEELDISNDDDELPEESRTVH